MPGPLDQRSRFPQSGLKIGDLRLDAIAAATRQRDGDAAVTLTGLMLADKAGEAIQQLWRLLGLRPPAGAAGLSVRSASDGLALSV